MFDDACAAALEHLWHAGSDASFDCPIPGHAGRASLGVPPDDKEREVRLLCCRGRWRSLGQIRAAQAYNVDRLRTNIELATWTRRLAYELGRFTPLEVELPQLPRGAPKVARPAWDGFRLLLGLRWADGPHRPVAWSVRFAAAWCSLGYQQAAAANRFLLKSEVIVPAGRRGYVTLYLPGAVRGEGQVSPENQGKSAAAAPSTRISGQALVERRLSVVREVDEATDEDDDRVARYERDYPDMTR